MPPIYRAIGGVAALLSGLILPAGGSHAADALAVDVINASEPTLCAEEDNVTLQFLSETVHGFVIEAAHPAYIGTIVMDRAEPDFHNCRFEDHGTASGTRRLTVYETPEWQLIGYTFPSFWRRSDVPLQIGERKELGLDLLQLWTRFQQRAEEVLVLYPNDGYWRARPLPPSHMRWSAYGSSFLIGPVEAGDRPFVDLSSIVFDPASLTFTIHFVRGGAATVRLGMLDQQRITLDIGLTEGVGQGRPFAALRSMFVTETNADVARIGWRGKDDKAWHDNPVMSFKRASVVELSAGRIAPSRHNTSAPDILFRDFSATGR